LVAVPSIGRATQITPRRAAPEADATRDLYERYARQIYSYCLHQLGNREEAEDATQSTFLNAFRGIQRGVDPEFESAWLYKIAQNVCLTRQRSSSRRRRVETPGDLEAMQDYVPAHQADSDELIRLPEALESMPEQQRKALLLREWQGLSYKEIAEELDLSQAAVETLLFRARRTLANGLSEAPAKKAGVAKRLRSSGDAGSALAILKSILFTGGAKVAATVATVAATSVVAAAPVARHVVADVVTPGHDRTPPVRHVKARAASSRRSVTAAASSLVVRHAASAGAAAATLGATVKHHRAHHARPVAHVSFMPTHRPRTPVEPAAATASPAPAPAAPSPAAETRVEATPPPAAAEAQPAPAEQAKKDDVKKDEGKSGGDSKEGTKRTAPPSQPASAPEPDDKVSSSPSSGQHESDSSPSAPKTNDRSTPSGNDQERDAQDSDHRNGDGSGARNDSAPRPSDSTAAPATTSPTAPVATTTTTPVAPVPAALPVGPVPSEPDAPAASDPQHSQSDKGDRGDQGHNGDGKGEGHRK
jgi:RNA polymerase sigma factor (sigma-70 family)